MVDQKEKDKISCKKKCCDCKYFRDYSIYTQYSGVPEYACIKNKEETIDCVTGEEKTIYADPYKKNADGCCKDWEEKVSITMPEKLKELIKEFENNSLYISTISFEQLLAELLLKILTEETTQVAATIEILKKYIENYLSDDSGYCEEGTVYHQIQLLIDFMNSWKIPDEWRKKK